MTVNRALVLVHLAQEGVGSLGEWLPAAGLELSERRLHEGDPVPLDLPDDCSALVVMGGAMGIEDVGRLPWLRDEMELIRRTAASGRPLLGVCLGAQLLAAATGGRVEVGASGPEVGVARVALTANALDDPLFHGAEQSVDVVQWHWDCVSMLPPHAVRLATSSKYPNQAFRVGAAAWGLQFHVETTGPMVASWAEADRERLAHIGIDAQAAAAEAGELSAALERTWRPVAERFAALAGDPA
ncbi:MAG TPA: type 1 glutamine amidotransferase [Mycobacteriales bacterium]|nr:type 1 glutamine amidotransferase [Mycobacteriales bacterium]